MKWNIFIGSLVLGLGLSTQSFGFDLLDRMLGADYGGCCEKAACCEASCGCEVVDPGCGCDDGCATKGCGQKKCCRRGLLDLFRSRKCSSGCADACCDVDPGCGCEVVDPGCGCDMGCAAKGCGHKCRRPLLDMFKRSCKSGCADACCDVDPGCGCEVVDPGCGCDMGCASKCCGRKRLNLLDRIFGCKRCKTSCCEPACCEPACGCEPGCGVDMMMKGGAAAPTEAAPSEAAPVPPAPVVDPSAFLPTKRHFIQTNLVR